MQNKRLKVYTFPSMQLHSCSLPWGFLEDRTRTDGVNQEDSPNKMYCSLGHLFPDEAVVSRPLIKHSVYACVCVCVGGLFTFLWFLAGIPLWIRCSLAYVLGKVRVCDIFRLLTGIQLASVLTPQLTPVQTLLPHKHTHPDGLFILERTPVGDESENATLVCPLCTQKDHESIFKIKFPNALLWISRNFCIKHVS